MREVRRAVDGYEILLDGVRVGCAFTKAWIERHPDYQDLLASSH